MSGPPPGLSAPVYDPYNFPNYTDATIARDLTFMVYGAAIYEAIMCLKLYASICSKAKLKTVIFQLITFAVILLSITTLFSVIIQWNQTATDIVLPESEYYLTCFNSSILIIAKYGYYIAATLRTKALLPRFPKILYFFYMMLAACMINNMVLLVLIIKVNNIIYNSTPMTFFNFLPDILALQDIFVGSSAFTTIFDMIFANLLIISFLYPIFTNLGLSPLQAFKKMVQMGDVQKALVAIAASIVYPIISQEAQGPYAQLVLPVILFWMHCQNSLFLHLSYFSATQLLKGNTGTMKTILHSDKSTKDTTAVSKSGGLKTREDTVVASAAATSQMENKV